jgi:hypothetical protein
MLTRGNWVFLVAALVCAWACGGEETGGGAGGGPAAGMLGQRCTTDSCATGLSCGRNFEVAGLCTASCANDQSCSLAAPGSGARCVTTTSGFCMLPCTASTVCPNGSQCGLAGGLMVCRAP